MVRTKLRQDAPLAAREKALRSVNQRWDRAKDRIRTETVNHFGDLLSVELLQCRLVVVIIGEIQ